MLAVEYDGRIIGVQDEHGIWKPMHHYTIEDLELALKEGKVFDLYEEEEKLLATMLILTGAISVLILIAYFLS